MTERQHGSQAFVNKKHATHNPPDIWNFDLYPYDGNSRFAFYFINYMKEGFEAAGWGRLIDFLRWFLMQKPFLRQLPIFYLKD